jgi:hypothetical protein
MMGKVRMGVDLLDPSPPPESSPTVGGGNYFLAQLRYYYRERRSSMSEKLMEYFNKQPRLGCLSTSGKNGMVDVACFGSPRMVDEKTVVMALRKNRTFENLKENPNAVFMIMEPGKTSAEYKGIRVYMRMKEYQTSGEKLEAVRAQTAKRVGEEAAKAVHAAVTFEVEDVRPIVDLGQGWEKSI